MEMIEVRMQMTEEIAVTVLAMGVSNIWTCGVRLDDTRAKLLLIIKLTPDS